MRYLSGALLGLAAAAHTGALAQVLGLGLLVFIGVVAFAFAIEAMIRDALKPPPRVHLPRGLLTDDELRRTNLRHK